MICSVLAQLKEVLILMKTIFSLIFFNLIFIDTTSLVYEQLNFVFPFFILISDHQMTLHLNRNNIV